MGGAGFAGCRCGGLGVMGDERWGGRAAGAGCAMDPGASGRVPAPGWGRSDGGVLPG